MKKIFISLALLLVLVGGGVAVHAQTPQVNNQSYIQVINNLIAQLQKLLAQLIAQQGTTTKPVACTMEVKQCPDGSSVGRQGPKCEFKACPIVNKNKTIGQLPTNIENGQVISLPFTLTGKAANVFEGQWGDVNMFDSLGNLLTTKHILAPCDYGKSCDFSVVLNGSPKTNSGYLIFSLDNPSGLPQNEKSYRVNIGFSNPASSWQTYRNEQYGFEVKHPAGCSVFAISPGKIGVCENEKGLMIEIFSKNEFTAPARTNDLVSWLDKFYGGEGRRMPGLISESYATLGSNPSVELTYRQATEDVNYSPISKIVVSSNTGNYYRISCSPESCDSFLPTFKFTK